MARASGGICGRALLMAGALSLLLATGIFLHSARGDVPSTEDPAERLVLRLHDLPPGFYPFDTSESAGREFVCEPLQPAEPGPGLQRFTERFSPAGCIGAYLRKYRVPGVGPTSAFVGTGAMDVGSDAAATSGFALAAQLLHRLVDDDPLEEVTPPETVGVVTRLFHWRDIPDFLGTGDQSSFVVWRSGNVLAATFAAANSLAVSDRIALDLARRQQAHIENPTPYTESERDFSEVGLDDPSLKLPIYWLGRRFAPGHGLPTARLESGVPTNGSFGLPGRKLSLQYSHAITIDSWREPGWKRFVATASPAVEVRNRRCTKAIEVALPRGHATVLGSYRRDFDVCPERPPNRYFAIVRIDGLVAAVNFASCKACLPLAPGPYNSLKGMRAIVRGLQLRPKPVYPAPAQP